MAYPPPGPGYSSGYPPSNPPGYPPSGGGYPPTGGAYPPPSGNTQVRSHFMCNEYVLVWYAVLEL